MNNLNYFSLAISGQEENNKMRHGSVKKAQRFPSKKTFRPKDTLALKANFRSPRCPKTILVFPSQKIHQLFSYTTRKLTLAANKNNLSTVERSRVMFGKFYSHLSPFGFQNSAVEYPMERANMKTTDYDELLRESHSNVLNFESTKFKKFQQNSAQNKPKLTNNAQWAALFVKKYGAKKENLCQQKAFKELNRKQKQAVYYQLRKKQVTFKEKNFAGSLFQKTRSFAKKGSDAINIKLALLLMIPILMAEILILNFSYLFYLALGFKIYFAALAALSIELFYMLASGCKGFVLQGLRWAVFALSAFTVSYSQYASDPKIKGLNDAKQSDILMLERQLKNHANATKSLMEQKKGLMADMKVYREKNMITLGRKRLQNEKDTIRRELKENQKSAHILSEKIALLKKEQAHTGAFSLVNIKVVEVSTWCTIAFFLLIQLLSGIFAKRFFQSVREYLERKPKKKFKRGGEMLWPAVT